MRDKNTIDPCPRRFFVLGILQSPCFPLSYQPADIQPIERETTVEPQFQQTLQSLQDYLMILLIVGVVLFAFAIAIRWLIFAKAGEPGWAAIVPISNTVVCIRLVARPRCHNFLLLIA